MLCTALRYPPHGVGTDAGTHTRQLYVDSTVPSDKVDKSFVVDFPDGDPTDIDAIKKLIYLKSTMPVNIQVVKVQSVEEKIVCVRLSSTHGLYGGGGGKEKAKMVTATNLGWTVWYAKSMKRMFYTRTTKDGTEKDWSFPYPDSFPPGDWSVRYNANDNSLYFFNSKDSSTEYDWYKILNMTERGKKALALRRDIDKAKSIATPNPTASRDNRDRQSNIVTDDAKREATKRKREEAAERYKSMPSADNDAKRKKKQQDAAAAKARKKKQEEKDAAAAARKKKQEEKEAKEAAARKKKQEEKKAKEAAAKKKIQEEKDSAAAARKKKDKADGEEEEDDDDDDETVTVSDESINQFFEGHDVGKESKASRLKSDDDGSAGTPRPLPPKVFNDFNRPPELQSFKPDILNDLNGAFVPAEEIAEDITHLYGFQKGKKLIRDVFHFPSRYERVYADLKKEPNARKTVLCFGPPGTGKTMFARVVVKEINSRGYMRVVASMIKNKYVGETEKRVKALFAYARCYGAFFLILWQQKDFIFDHPDSDKMQLAVEITNQHHDAVFLFNPFLFELSQVLSSFLSTKLMPFLWTEMQTTRRVVTACR